MRLALFALILSVTASAQTAWVIDTDAGSDDYLAIAYLLAKPNVRVEAITSVNGLSGAAAGARMVARILTLAGRRDIPVYAGAERPLAGDRAFPAEWRKMSEHLPGVQLPAFTGSLAPETAEAFLTRRLAQPVRILALGPLTNLAVVLRKHPALARNIQELVIMGGAVNVKGNLKDGDLFKTTNEYAEWNIFIDPAAAAYVFTHVPAPIKLVPLDATNQVPVRAGHIRAFERQAAHSALGRLATNILHLDEPMIQEGYYYAWDPLAAVAAAEPNFAAFTPVALRVSEQPGEEGRTVAVQGRPNAQVMAKPDAARFHAEFLGAFSQSARGRR